MKKNFTPKLFGLALTTALTLTTLTAGQNYYIAVDSFNENGITPGTVFVL